jgi:hypothetical protein
LQNRTEDTISRGKLRSWQAKELAEPHEGQLGHDLEGQAEELAEPHEGQLGHELEGQAEELAEPHESQLGHDLEGQAEKPNSAHATMRTADEYDEQTCRLDGEAPKPIGDSREIQRRWIKPRGQQNQ